MKWENLRKNKCPKCGKDMMDGLVAEPYVSDRVLKHPCGFQIGERRYGEIVADRTGRYIDEEIRRQKEEGDVGLEES